MNELYLKQCELIKGKVIGQDDAVAASASGHLSTQSGGGQGFCQGQHLCIIARLPAQQAPDIWLALAHGARLSQALNCRKP